MGLTSSSHLMPLCNSCRLCSDQHRSSFLVVTLFQHGIFLKVRAHNGWDFGKSEGTPKLSYLAKVKIAWALISQALKHFLVRSVTKVNCFMHCCSENTYLRSGNQSIESKREVKFMYKSGRMGCVLQRVGGIPLKLKKCISCICLSVVFFLEVS